MSDDPQARAARMRQLEAAVSAFLAEQAGAPPAALDDPGCAELLAAMRAGDDAATAATAPGDGVAQLVQGRVLGDFRLRRELGRGGMGVVYDAEQISLQRRVAVKVLAADAALQPQSLARFRREATIIAGLHHPGIVEVIGVGSEGALHYFAMELVSGAPLARVVEALRGTPMAQLRGIDVGNAVADLAGAPRPAPDSPVWNRSYVAVVVGIVADVADALEHAHEAGVIHRDVKPSNILIQPDGRAVLTDFGVARQELQPGLTRTGDFAGTPHYVAPEQLRAGAAAVDRRADVFSLGATLYELLALARPFDAPSVPAILARIASREPQSLQRRSPLVVADLAAVTAKAMEKLPERRYQSAAAFARDLRAFLAYQPVQARRASPLVRLRRWARREPLRAALAAVLVLTVPSLTALAGYLVAHRSDLATGAAVRLDRQVEDLLLDGYRDLFGSSKAAARTAFEAALRLDPGNTLARGGLAFALFGAGDAAAARQVLRAGEVAELRELEPLLLRTQGGAVAGGGAAALPVAQFFRGVVHNLDGDFAAAHADLLQAALGSRSPNRVFYLQLLDAAVGLDDRGRVEAVLACLDSIWPGDPRNLEARSLALGHIDAAASLAAAQALLQLQPGSARALELVGIALIDLGRAAEAIPDLEAAVRTAPTMSNCCSLGLALHRAGRDDEAIAAYEEAARRDDKVPEPQLNLGSVYEEQGRFAEALAAYDRALAVSKDFARAHVGRGRALTGLSRGDEAVAAFERALTTASPPIAIQAYIGICGASLEPEQLPRNLTAVRQAARLLLDLGAAAQALGLLRSGVQLATAAGREPDEAFRAVLVEAERRAAPPADASK